MLPKSRELFTMTVLILGFAGMVSAQQVSLDVRNEKLVNVFKVLRKQSDYAFVFPQKLMDKALPVTLKIKNANLKEALNQIFKGQPLRYEIQDKTIVVTDFPGAILQGLQKRVEEPAMNNQEPIRGTVRDNAGNPLGGVTVIVLETGTTVGTNHYGSFEVLATIGNTLQFRYLGHRPFEAKVTSDQLNIAMQYTFNEIAEVNVTVNTGFQTMNKERSTGSFTKVDNELFNRRVGTSVIDRLEGVTSGLMFNGNHVNYPNSSPFNIRGLSTIFADTKPLIIVDNFPFDGDLSNINPNDVEDITVLKDAAASSIWGARSGNGVIVITTKKGAMNQQMNISFNSNFTYTAKPDIYYGQNFLDASSYIDSEQFLFDKGYYNSNITNIRKPTLSPIVEILLNKRNNAISEADANAQMDVYRSYDFRDDLSKYFYRSTGTQQYALNLSGGADKVSYYFSAGYDDAPSINVGNGYKRISLNSNTIFRPIKQLEATVGIMHIISNNKNNNLGNITTISRNTYYPYARMVDDEGNSLALPKDYRLSYIQGLDNTGLLDWQYRPVDELNNADNTGKSMHTRLNTSLKYTFIPGLSLEARYQLEKQNASTYNLQNEQSYFTRNLINLNTQVGTGGAFTYGVPKGGILDQGSSEMTSQSIRAQINLDRKFGLDHEVTAIAGIDGKEVITDINVWRLYGFNVNTGTSTAVNYEMNYPKYGNLATASRIPYVDRYNKLTDIYFSYFTNAAYTYKKRYTLSGSARIDQSNLFGVNTNQKSVPLWSIGGAWVASKESFLQQDWIDLLKLRTTFGYNGNIDKSVSAYATGVFRSGGLLTGAPFVTLQSPPNPRLRWERISMWNIGTDFSFLKGAVSGSIEYYNRRGTDMLGYAALDPTVGMDQFKGNVANITGNGIDADLVFRAGKKVQWSGNLLFSISRDKVTEYDRKVTLTQYMQAASGELGATSAFTPIVGQPIFGIYSYPWGGLDPENGDPLIRTDDGSHKDYAALFSSTDFSQLVYHGNARPTHFGAFRNTVAYKGLSLSVNLTYKFGYYFRRSSINYTSLAASWLGHSDYNSRWQQQGDEQTTEIPSFTYPLNTNRNNFFAGSEVLVEKGDHIRLQDIRLGYDIPISRTLRIKNLHVYAYANNLGIIWKSTDTTIDPDFVTTRFVNPTTYAFGLQCTF